MEWRGNEIGLQNGIMAAPFGRDTLPEHWSFGVCGDGRVFFVHDETSTTTWLHPRTGEPVNSGHMIRSDLPRGWEEGFTDEGAGYFINHNQRTTSFRHPVTGQVSQENVDFILQEQPGGRMSNPQQADLRLSSTISEASTAITSSTVDTASGSKGSRSSGRVLHFGKREQSIKRNPNVPVVVRGWLYKQDSSGMRLWKRKWFVLADYCLFYYKDSREESVLGSIPLPSYVISAVEPEDHIIRKYAFKASHTGMRSYIYNRSSVIGSQAEHSGMRTYFFSTDTQEDMNGWVKAMNQAALMQNHTASLKRPSETLEKSEMPSVSERQAVPQTNHVNNYAETAPQPPVDLHLHSDGVVLQPADIHQETEEHCSFWNDTPNPIAPEIPLGGGNVEIEMDTVPPSSLPPLPNLTPYSASSPTSAPPSREQLRAPSCAASTLPPGACLRNGTPTLEPNGMGTGTYQRAPLPPQVMDTHRQVQRRSALEQVEHWVKVQRAEHKGPPSRGSTLPRHTPPTQPKFISLEAYQTLPKTPRHSPPTAARHGEYKYAQDRLSHFRLGPPDSQGGGARDGGSIGGPGTVWQLYEWQQRHQFRHGSPTAPLYTPAPDYPFGPRPPSTVPPSAPRPSSEVPRCVSVPPDPSDIPPLGPPRGSRALSPLRRPHTPADRVVVMPLGERPVLDVPVAGSPRRTKSQLFNAATIDKRSMPPSGYITHTVSAPSLHGKTPEELTLLLIQLRRHQAKMAAARHHTLTQLQHFNYSPSGPHLRATNNNPLFSSGLSSLGSLLGPPGPMGHGSSSQVDDTYMQLKKDLEYLDLKVVGSQTLKEATKPVKIAESDVDVKLSGLCEQDKTLKELEVRISSLKDDKDKLESVLDLSRQQMEQYRDQAAHLEKIAYQQRLLQEDVVHIRAQISRVSTEMSRAWEEYSRLESSVEKLRTALQTTMNYSATPQREKTEIKRELWRIEDVMAGLSASKANYKITIDSVQNPERKLVPSVLDPAAPSQYPAPPLGEVTPPPLSSYKLPHNPVPKWAEDEAPPRPPLPHLYDYEDPPPAIPPLPKEASAVVRHTSVRGLKRQSDERKRDREIGGCVNGDCKVELRSYLSEPELPGMGRSSTGSEGGYQTLPNKGLSGSSSRLNQSSNISSYVTLRRGAAGSAGRERPRSALEQLYSSDQQPQSLAQAPRGRMSAEEQLERMKRHQRALVRERKRNLSQGERHSTTTTHRSSSSTRPLSSTDLGSWRREQHDLDLQQKQRAQVEERQGAEGQSDEGRRELKERERIQSDEWLTVMATPMRETDLEPLDYDLDLSRELSKPQKVPISERYVESDPGEPLSQEEMEERQRRAARIKNILAKSNVQNIHPSSGVAVPLDFTDLDLAMQQQERIMNVSHALASEASIKSKQFTAKAQLSAD
ncbi:pleckstrin homology domain-containing family A member 7-like isoform X3 [Coregonus clupeaformis]|uniref:pleckstrin homology domain-containing family A member 7-like isoform X3 n=1 Tax=Coregonus clupeaformis TaxID=59861 RepID=UPI001E1C2E4F|nr:pleckstrin homology domain-containing family A member 7-like isoform X3 [Coregonus clupeaformis]